MPGGGPAPGGLQHVPGGAPGYTCVCPPGYAVPTGSPKGGSAPAYPGSEDESGASGAGSGGGGVAGARPPYGNLTHPHNGTLPIGNSSGHARPIQHGFVKYPHVGRNPISKGAAPPYPSPVVDEAGAEPEDGEEREDDENDEDDEEEATPTFSTVTDKAPSAAGSSEPAGGPDQGETPMPEVYGDGEDIKAAGSEDGDAADGAPGDEDEGDEDGEEGGEYEDDEEEGDEDEDETGESPPSYGDM